MSRRQEEPNFSTILTKMNWIRNRCRRVMTNPLKFPGPCCFTSPQELFRNSPNFGILVEFTTVRRWRNWQTHQLEVLAPKRHRGSSPLFRTKILSSGPAGLTWKAAYKMNLLLIFVVVLHVIVSLFLIGVVLLQQGRSADLAGAFGGQGSQTAFGPRAAANVLTRLTTWSAIIFMCTSITLTVLYQRSTTGSKSVLDNASQSTPAKSGK